MDGLVPTVRDKKFQNWIKCRLALLFAKQGLQKFVIDELTQFQKETLTEILNKINLPADTVCTTCTTENVLSCPTKNFCYIPRDRQCIRHVGTLPEMIPKMCPMKICFVFKEAIRRDHRYNVPSWKNTQATEWCVNSFEIAKCYMPQDGYSHVSTIADTDFNGILAVIINNKRFQSKVESPLNQANNVFNEARDIGRQLRHSSDLSVDDKERDYYISTLIRVLSDPKCLAANNDAKEAVDKLNQLKANTLSITPADIDSQSNYITELERARVQGDKRAIVEKIEKLTLKLGAYLEILQPRAETPTIAETNKKELTTVSAREKHMTKSGDRLETEDEDNTDTEDEETETPWTNFARPPECKTSALVWDAKAAALKSVCRIRYKEIRGTGFRVGSRYIMTCAHVLDGIWNKGQKSIPNQNKEEVLDKTIVEFDYFKTDSAITEFKIGRCEFIDHELDVAILELQPRESENVPMRPHFTRFEKPDGDSTFHLIGHDGGNQMEIDENVQLLKKGKEMSTLCENVISKSKELGKEYKWINVVKKKYRIPRMHYFHTSFLVGASGSPGVMFQNDGSAVVVTMLSHGYPSWYHDPKCDKDIKRQWDLKYCIEAGVNIDAVYNTLEAENVELCNDIFAHKRC